MPYEHNPKISIIIPAYNVEDYIDECIRSVREQTLQDIEIIVVNDGSTDGTPEIIKKHSEEDKRIRCFSHENKGVAESRNVGMDNARGKYIYFVDSDDIVIEDACEKLYEISEKNELDILSFAAKTVYSSEELKKKHPEYITTYSFDKKYEYPLQSGIELMTGFFNNNEYRCPVWMNLYNREFIESNDIRFYNVSHEDELFAFNTLLKAKRTMSLSDVFYIRRVRAFSVMTSEPTEENLKSNVVIYSEMLRLCFEEETQGYSKTLSNATETLFKSIKWRYSMLGKERSSNLELDTDVQMVIYDALLKRVEADIERNALTKNKAKLESEKASLLENNKKNESEIARLKKNKEKADAKLAALEKKLKKIENSRSYKFSRKLSAIVRPLRSFFKRFSSKR